MRFFKHAAMAVLILAGAILGVSCLGEQGVGVEDVVFNDNGTMTVNLTNGESYTSTDLLVPRAFQGLRVAPGRRGSRSKHDCGHGIHRVRWDHLPEVRLRQRYLDAGA